MISIGVAGKGGTGKTTLSALIVITLLRKGKKPVLAVDADPNSNLSETLGIAAPQSLVEIVDSVMEVKDNLPAGLEKTKYLEFKIKEAIHEDEGFDLLMMGKTEGEGCYCHANNLLREFLDRIWKNYSFVVMDNEAGLEHLSRRTSRDLNFLLITTHNTRNSLLSVKRIKEMVQKLNLRIGKTFVVMNNVGYFQHNTYQQDPQDFDFLIPYDEEILIRSQEGKGLLNLPDSSPALIAVRKLLDNLMEL